MQDSVRGELFEEKDLKMKDREEQSCELTVKKEDNSVLEEETVGAGHHSRKTAACSNHFFTTTTMCGGHHMLSRVFSQSCQKFSSYVLQNFKHNQQCGNIISYKFLFFATLENNRHVYDIVMMFFSPVFRGLLFSPIGTVLGSSLEFHCGLGSHPVDDLVDRCVAFFSPLSAPSGLRVAVDEEALVHSSGPRRSRRGGSGAS